jgi:hypothetical protein
MKLSSTVILGVFTAFALSTVPACDDKKDDKKAEDKKDAKAKTEVKTETKTEVKTEVKTAEPTAAEGGGGGGGDKIGVAECDEYIEKYSKCIADKVPEAARAQMKDAMDLSAKQWKEAAVGPAKDGLSTACKAALDAAKQATSTLGCVW